MCRAFVEIAEDEKLTKFDDVESNLRAQICLKMDKLAKKILICYFDIEKDLQLETLKNLDGNLKDFRRNQVNY